MNNNDSTRDVKTFKVQPKIAIIGSGPAGMTIAKQLVNEKYKIKIFELSTEPGGLLVFGIPEFRIKKDSIRKNVQKLKDQGVEFECNVMIGRDKSIQDIYDEGYNLIFLGLGLRVPFDLNGFSTDIEGIYQAADLLNDVQRLLNEGQTLKDSYVNAGDRVLVIGGGNVALDAAETSIRCDNVDVTVVYRRDQPQMPCTESEYKTALRQNVKFLFKSAPTKAIVKDGKFAGLEYEKQIILEDGSMKSTGEFEVIEAEKVFVAIGYKSGNEVFEQIKDLKVNKKGLVEVQSEPYYGMTNIPGIFSAGDVVHGAKTVALAISESKKVAVSIQQYVEDNFR